MIWAEGWKVLEQKLKKFTANHGKILFLCIGNEMRGDDSAGPLIADKLDRIFAENPDIKVINAGTVPENYTGVIRNETPSHIIFVDAVEMDMEPGSLRLVESDEIANYSISTHAMPLSFMIKYLKSFIKSEIILIGIQPKNLEMSNTISSEVMEGIEKLINHLQNIFS
jgi:hydrogenase 3 maturation protease